MNSILCQIIIYLSITPKFIILSSNVIQKMLPIRENKCTDILLITTVNRLLQEPHQTALRLHTPTATVQYNGPLQYPCYSMLQ